MSLQPGLTATIRVIVTEADTAIALGSGDVPVLGTPRVVSLLEAAAVAAVAGSLGPGETTVGSTIAVDHLRATPVGREVAATATLTAFEGRRLTFRVALADGEATAAAGSHVRVIVDRIAFLGRST